MLDKLDERIWKNRHLCTAAMGGNHGPDLAFLERQHVVVAVRQRVRLQVQLGRHLVAPNGGQTRQTVAVLVTPYPQLASLHLVTELLGNDIFELEARSLGHPTLGSLGNREPRLKNEKQEAWEEKKGKKKEKKKRKTFDASGGASPAPNPRAESMTPSSHETTHIHVVFFLTLGWRQ